MAITTQLSQGSTGSQVQELQRFLGITADGVFGPKTKAAVVAFQQKNNLSPDGVVGPKTLAVVNQKLNPSNNLVAIDPSLHKNDYTNTPAGQASNTDANGNPINQVLPPGIGNQTVFQLKPEAFNTLVPQLVPGTPEYEAALEKINTSFYDIMQQQLTASTEQEKQVADTDYNNLKDYIQNNLNITLSNDAIQGWDQLQNVRNQYSTQNIEGSGLQNESIDNYLKKVRQADANSRNDANQRKATAQETYYRTYATPAQVKALIDSDPATAKSYGLIPSDEIKATMNVSALKAKYPTMSDAEIQRNIAAVFDENGNYRSNLYQKYMTGGNPMGNTGASIDPLKVQKDADGNIISYGDLNPTDSGILDIQSAKRIGQQVNAEVANQQAVRAAQKKAGLTPSNTGTDPMTNTQFLTQPNSTPSSGPASNLYAQNQPTPNTTTPPDLKNPVGQPTPLLVNPPGALFDRNTGKPLPQTNQTSSVSSIQTQKPSGTNDIRTSQGLLVNPPGALFDRNTGKRL